MLLVMFNGPMDGWEYPYTGFPPLHWVFAPESNTPGSIYTWANEQTQDGKWKYYFNATATMKVNNRYRQVVEGETDSGPELRRQD